MSETTSDNDDTVRSLAIRTYLNAAYSLYPHVVGRELDSLLWSSNHVRFDWKAMLVTNFSKEGFGGSGCGGSGNGRSGGSGGSGGCGSGGSGGGRTPIPQGFQSCQGYILH